MGEDGGQFGASLGDLRVAVSSSLLGGLQLLVVDDDRDSLELITALLCSYGAEVRAATSTRQALELLDPLPNVLISDIRMPLEDGYSLLNQIKAHRAEQFQSIVKIAVTACALEIDRQTALNCGYQHCLCKPLDFDELVATVLSLTGR